MTAAASLIVDPEWEAETKEEHQLHLEKLYDKHQLLPRVRTAFRECTGRNFVELAEQEELNVDFTIDLLAQMAVHKRTTVPTIVGCLRHHFDTVQKVASELERAVDANFVSYSSPDKQLIVIYDISPHLQAELEKYQYPLPMVVPPKELQHNLDSGYLTGKSSVILRDNHHDDDVCLDHLNRMNQIAMSLNLDVAKTIQNKWKGLDKKAEDETWEDFKKRQKAFSKYDRVSKDVMRILLKEGNKLYLTHKYDKRGRTYCMGFHITYQGTDWNKAVIELHEKELITD
jgi:hypothetical protein